MRRRSLAIFIFVSLFCTALVFPDSSENAADEVLSLKQIDSLIDSEKYNDALREVSKYMSAFPNDFDRAQKRITRIMKLREQYNEGASALVDVIRNGDGSRNDKLTKIRELEVSEKEPTAYVSDFLDLARRTVTLGEVLVHYNRIMREGAELVKKESYVEAAIKFEEGFSIKNEKSDIVFDVDTEGTEFGGEGRVVVYDSDITVPVQRSVSNVRSYVAGSSSSSGMAARISECEKSYSEYLKALSSGNFPSVDSALKKVNSSFGKLAELRNLVMKEASVLDRANALAIKRNPLLGDSSYIYFQERFIIGDESNPDTGIVGAMDAYYNTRIESMKQKTNQVVADIFSAAIGNLPEKSIYTLGDKIDAEKERAKTAGDYVRASRSLHALYSSEKDIDGKSPVESDRQYTQSMDFALQYINALSLAFDSAKTLANEKPFAQLNDDELSDGIVSLVNGRLLNYDKIRTDSKKYLPVVSAENQRETEYFSEKEKREKELAELLAMSGGKLNISSSKSRSTAGVQIADEPVDFRSQTSYFLALTSMNEAEANSRSQRLWVHLAKAYGGLAGESYARYEKLCAEAEVLLAGEKESTEDSGDGLQFVKKYPAEANKKSSVLNSELQKKRNEFASQKKALVGAEPYRMSDMELNTAMLNFERIVSDFEKLAARCKVVLSESDRQVRSYEALLRQAYEQYEIAQSAYKKENFDAANVAIDSASEKFAAALDIEYSDKIREMREISLSNLAMKIQQSEYEKVLREVYSLKDKAATAYYSSDFDGAESLLVSAQSKWAKISTETEPEIENLLAIVSTVKGVAYGRVLELSDPHYPELSYSLDMARQNFERGVKLKKQDKTDEAKEAFNSALSYIRNVQNVYPLNKSAQLINLGIHRELDPEGFPRLFEQQYNAAKIKTDRRERLAELEDLYEINPDYPGLAQEIYNIKDSLGMFPKKEVKKEVKKSADSKIAEARKAFKNAGSDEDKLNVALRLANEAIAIDGTSKAAKELKLEIQLKIGSTATPILSQNDEKMYAEAARLFNQRRFADAKTLMDKLLTGRAAQKSRKVIDLYNRILKRV